MHGECALPTRRPGTEQSFHNMIFLCDLVGWAEMMVIGHNEVYALEYEL